MTVLEKVARLFSVRKNPDAFAVLSPTGSVRNEAKIVCELFEKGLQSYHLRKPRWNPDRVQAWIKSIPKIYRSRIILHQFPELVEKFGLGGFHIRCDEAVPDSLPAEKISAQCQHYADIEKCDKRFRCLMLGPIFPKPDRDLTVPARTLQEYAAIVAYHRKQGGTAKIFAFGGVSENNVKQCRKMGFDGVAVVGAVWDDGKEPVPAFKKLCRKW